MSDPYLDDLEFANKANIEAARKFKAERDALVKAMEAISRATIEGRVCNDVAWFDQITTLYDFCELTLDQVLGRVAPHPIEKIEGGK